MNIRKYKKVVLFTIIVMIVIIALNFLLSESDETPSTNTAPTDVTDESFETSPEITFYPIPQTFVNVEEVAGNEKYLEGRKVGNADIPSSLATQFVQNNNYIIQYSPESEAILISIQNSPFDEHRLAAEKELLDVLELSRADACKLDVSITTPQAINPTKTGTVYRLSFCSNI